MIKTMAASKTIAIDENSGSLVEQIYLYLLNGILDGEYKVGERLPLSVDLAKQAGVSRAPAKGALKRLVDEGIVCQKKYQGFFVRTNEAKAGVRRGTIGLITPGIASDWFPHAADIAPTFGIWRFEQVVAKATKQGFLLQEVTLNNLPQPLVWEPDLRGIISMVPRHRLAACNLAPEIPVVYLGVEEPQSYPAVVGDVAYGVNQLCAYLLERGHRRLALCGPAYWDNHLFALARYGYGEALRAAGLLELADKKEIPRLSAEDTGGLKNFLANCKVAGCSALITLSNPLANELIKLAPTLGLPVPAALSVVSLLHGTVREPGREPFDYIGLKYQWEEIVDACFAFLKDPLKIRNLSKMVFKAEITQGESVGRRPVE